MSLSLCFVVATISAMCVPTQMEMHRLVTSEHLISIRTISKACNGDKLLGVMRQLL